MAELSITAEAWARSRGISRQTSGLVPVASGTVHFSDLDAKSEAIFFRYQEGWKARAFPEKAFIAGGGWKPSFWNIEQVLAANSGTVFCTEGEVDALSIIEAGIPPSQVLSVPNGARLKPQDNPRESRGYGYVLEALKQGLSRIKRFVWCGDADEPGLALRADMLRILGAARFMYVTWPDGINDANDMLRLQGAEALHAILTAGAVPWPTGGIYRLSELPPPPDLTIWKPSIPGFEGKVRLAPRTLSLVTGNPGHGKTVCFGQIWYEVAKSYNLVCCIASFETTPKPHLRRQLRTLLTGKLEIEMSEQELAQADAWIEEHYVFLLHSEQRPTLEWFLDCAETAVVRHGAKIVQLDPWNRLEAMRSPKETETEYILRCLRAMYVFATDMDCHLQVVAHPAKMDGGRRGQPPTLEDVSGSRHWENIIDQGFVIHRPEMFDGTERKTHADFYHRKARFEELGYPCKIALDYNLAQRKYVPLFDATEFNATAEGV